MEYKSKVCRKNRRRIKQGIKQGIEQGAKEEQKEIARNMLKENIDISIIIKCTNLTKEEIEKLEE